MSQRRALQASSSAVVDAKRASKQQQLQLERQKLDPHSVILSPQHFKNNLGVAYFLRIYMTIVAGSAVGILGVEGWGGFAVYLISQLLCTVPILVKCGGNYKQFFPSWDKVYLEHIFSSTAILSYILFWMIFYNVCHVF
ncbi:hypothetical protein OEZ85_003794 [Tetradesmus obliquus]|uniref:ER membrane protein complex subunit 6 n=1 Tax=Tetradesmus obliquus TaxID=3088 RepID=A0ABY8UFE8_TETOB|nr:hypothetical protein OEZ85_003794 [Tetradesmus obliquus]